MSYYSWQLMNYTEKIALLSVVGALMFVPGVMLQARHTLDVTSFRWGKAVPEETKARIIELLRKLPASVKLNVREFGISRSMLRADELGIYYPRLKRINFRTADFTDDTFYHEIGHSIFADAIDRDDIAFLEKLSPEFAQWQAGRITELRWLHPEARRLTDSELLYEYDIPFRSIEESFASSFSAHVRGLTVGPSMVARMLEKMFPRRVMPRGVK